MSRAFLSENESQFDEEDVPEIRNPLPPGARNRMTPEGAARLQEELQVLANQERPRVHSLITRQTADAGPDRDALSQERRHLRQLDRRIEYLTRMAQLLEVVDPAGQDPGRVLFGATVAVEEEGSDAGASGIAREYRIVGVDEADPARGRVSWISPIARALTGARVGDTVTLRLPDGQTRLVVRTIRYS